MRWVLVAAALGLAGCAAPPAGPLPTPPSPLTTPDPRFIPAQARMLALDPGATDRLSAGDATRDPARWERHVRQDAFCQDWAHNVHVRLARDSEFFAAMVVGTSTTHRRAYADCMASFARSDRFLGR